VYILKGVDAKFLECDVSASDWSTDSELLETVNLEEISSMPCKTKGLCATVLMLNLCGTHPHVRDSYTVVVLVLYKNQIPF
jgi:hypothetical protein